MNISPDVARDPTRKLVKISQFENGFSDELEKIAQMLARLAKTRKARGVVSKVRGVKSTTKVKLEATPTMRGAKEDEFQAGLAAARRAKDPAALGEATTMLSGDLSVSPESIKKLLQRRKDLKQLPKIKPPKTKTKWKFTPVEAR